jgi:hypothetical protein
VNCLLNMFISKVIRKLATQRQDCHALSFI